MSWRARFAGEEHPAAPELRVDGWWVWLVSPGPRAGFDAATPDGPWVREARVADCEAVVHLRTVGTWRGLACAVVDERGDELLLHDLGGVAADAERLGFVPGGPGVRRRWVPRDEVRGLRQEQTLVAG